MANDKLIEKLRQKKMDELGAKKLHSWRITRLNKYILLLDLLALIVPIGYFTVRYVNKGTSPITTVELIWLFAATLLLILGIVKCVCRWQARVENHNRLMGGNINSIAHSDHLLNLYSKGNVDDTTINLFLLDTAQDIADTLALGTVKESERQLAYREALKEFEPGSRCFECNASPWQYKPGSCQLCGNTPEDKSNNTKS